MGNTFKATSLNVKDTQFSKYVHGFHFLNVFRNASLKIQLNKVKGFYQKLALIYSTNFYVAFHLFLETVEIKP